MNKRNATSTAQRQTKVIWKQRYATRHKGQKDTNRKAFTRFQYTKLTSKL